MKSLVQRRFGAAAADYATSALHAKGLSLAQLIVLTRPEPSWRVLDVATGAGHTAFAFAPHIVQVTASDITAEMLAEARKLAESKGLANVEVAPADADALPFPAANFDLVSCRLAAHHFDDVTAFAREAWRVLKPGGTLALVDNIAPDAAILPERSPGELLDCALAFNAFKKLSDPSHVRCLGLLEWDRLLSDVGFEIAHREWMEKDVEFGPLIERMRCDEATIARLRAMLRDEPLHSFLRPRETDTGIVFTLQERIILARKPR